MAPGREASGSWERHRARPTDLRPYGAPWRPKTAPHRSTPSKRAGPRRQVKRSEPDDGLEARARRRRCQRPCGSGAAWQGSWSLNHIDTHGFEVPSSIPPFPASDGRRGPQLNCTCAYPQVSASSASDLRAHHPEVPCGAADPCPSGRGSCTLLGRTRRGRRWWKGARIRNCRTGTEQLAAAP